MSREIPVDLVSHLSGSNHTTCILIKVTPVQPGYAPYGVTTMNTDVNYDDGAGVLSYSASIGAEPSTLNSSADLSVDAGESRSLMPVYDTPVSEADLIRGAYDFAKFSAYLVNYEDLTPGRHILLQSGTLGRNTVTDSGLSFTTELRGLAQGLRQTITEKWSLSCRATFGSKPKWVYDQPVAIKNAGFSASASGWTLAAQGTGNTTWSATGGRTTPGAIHFTGAGEANNGSIISDPYEVAEGRSITASIWGRMPSGTDGSSFEIALLWYDATDAQISESGGGEVSRGGGAGLRQATVTASAPVGTAAVRIAVWLNASASETTTEIYIDDVEWDLTINGVTAPAGAVTERYPCMYDIESLWEYGTVDGVGLEYTRTFITSGLAPAFGGVPGMVRWLTGMNAGREDEVEGFVDADGVQTIDLTFTTMFPITTGDTFQFRDDCPKTPGACKDRSNWPRYRGEPTIPIADNGAIAAGSIVGSAGNVTTTTEAA